MIDLNINLYMLTQLFNIPASRLKAYEDKPIEEIIELEAASGNKKAQEFDKEILQNPQKMIEFFKIDGKGQLCFTTHNLEPINILKDNNYSLDFLSNDSRLFSWKKNGNKSPLNNYINGLIPYSPFLVESFDFDILLDEEK